jgi:hypothetical protein
VPVASHRNIWQSSCIYRQKERKKERKKKRKKSQRMYEVNAEEMKDTKKNKL